MRYAYLGTSGFAVGVLDGLLAAGPAPALVVTPPDRPQGRGRRLRPPPLAAAAAERGLELLQAESVNDPAALERIRAAAPELGLVCAFGQLVREPLLSELELLNVHPSLLPRWRGAAPIERAIMAGDRHTGVTIIRLTERLDAGPIALAEELEIGAGEDCGSLTARLAALGGELAARALERWRDGELQFAEQDDREATYAEKIQPAERRLDPRGPAAQLERAVRALTPAIGAYLELEGGERLGVSEAALADPGEGRAPAPGEVEAAAGELLLGCSPGALRLERVQPPGGRPMGATDYLRGHPPPRPAR